MSKPRPSDGAANESSAQPLLERISPVGVTYSLTILLAFFFLLPFAFRAARLSLGNRSNDVKDWLPADFIETSELRWFGKYYAGESFVLATWPGCTEEDQRLKMLSSKLLHECEGSDPTEFISDPALAASYAAAREFGRKHGLLPASRQFDNWGGQNEKWLASSSGRWYYILPDGKLYRWEGKENGPAGALRAIKRQMGNIEIEGTFMAAFGSDAQSPLANPFYNDPSLLALPLFRTVETGPGIVAELSKEGGLLWPRGNLVEPSRRPVVARRRAMERLTGTMFGPAIPADFDWSAKAFRNLLSEEQQSQLPPLFDETVGVALQKYADEHFDGETDALAQSELKHQTDAMYAVFDATQVAPPPRQTCLIVTLTDAGKSNLPHVLGRGVLGGPRGRLLELAGDSGVFPAPPPSMAPPPFDRVASAEGSGMPPLRLGGPPVDNLAIDEEGTITLVRLVGYSILVGALLSYFCFRSLKITIMVFVVGGSAAMLSMAIVSWTGGHVDAILMSMPSLVYVLGLSGAIHVVNYYRDEVRTGGRRGAAGRALRSALFPCALAALTTAIGLGSLHTSNLAPISNFGVYSAIGVIATLAILFSYLPAALQTFVTESKSVAAADKAAQAAQKDDAEEHGWLSNCWAGLGHWITSHHWLVNVTCMIILIGAAFGLPKIRTSVQLLKLFDSKAHIIRDYEWLEANFGKLVPMELVLRVPEDYQASVIATGDDSQDSAPGATDSSEPVSEMPLDILERVEIVARIGQVVESTLGEQGLNVVGSAMAANTFLPPLPEVSNKYSPSRSFMIKKLNEGRADLLESDYLRIEDDKAFADSELWRISLRVGALSDVDYGKFISTLRTAVEPVLRAYDTRDQLIRVLETTEELADVQRPRVLLLGNAPPVSIQSATLLKPATGEEPEDEAESNARIDTRQIYLSTLAELLRGERINATWIDHHDPKNKLEIGNDKWGRMLDAVDAIVWVDTVAAPLDDLDKCCAVVDGFEIASRTVYPVLEDGQIPAVANAGNLQVVYTGVVPVVYKAQRTLLGSLVESIGWACVLIALVMIMLLNPAASPWSMPRPDNLAYGIAAGAVSMIPNMFPLLLVFGIMGHLGRDVDIGTMMTASVAMGVAVDDTVHFLNWFRTYLDKGYDRIKAVELTYRRVGPAMTQTTIVGGLGLFVFALSTFTPTQRFGTQMLVLLLAALIGDLILLPALLASPLGRFFKTRVVPETKSGSKPDSGGPAGDRPTDEASAAANASDQNPDRASVSQEASPAISLRVHPDNEDTQTPPREFRG